jgi:HEAT repeat protein
MTDSAELLPPATTRGGRIGLLRAARISAVLALALPHGGCLGLLIGYDLGREAGKNDARHLEWSEPERLTWVATEARDPRERAAALERLEAVWAAPPRNHLEAAPEVERRLPRWAEALDDPVVRDRARSFVEALAGTEVLVTPADLTAMERRTDDAEEAAERAERAALRVYALERIGRRQPGAAGLLRRGLSWKGSAVRVQSTLLFSYTIRTDSLAVAVACALALHEVTGEVDAVLPVLVEGLRDPEERVRIDAVIGLGRLGPAARGHLDALVEAESGGSAAIRRAAVRARTRIARGP